MEKKDGKKILKCKICTKEIIGEPTLVPWVKGDKEKLVEMLNKIIPHLQEVCELLNHDERIGLSVAKRCSILSIVIDYLLEFSLISNHNKIALIELIKARIINNSIRIFIQGNVIDRSEKGAFVV